MRSDLKRKRLYFHADFTSFDISAHFDEDYIALHQYVSLLCRNITVSLKQDPYPVLFCNWSDFKLNIHDWTLLLLFSAPWNCYDVQNPGKQNAGFER